jgi:PAS domain S-box-containing protein
VEGENAYTSPAGVTGYYEYTFVPLLAPDGTVESIGGHTRDTTERRRAEEQLRRATDRLEAAHTAAELGMWSWDVQADHLIADRNLAFFFGIDERAAAEGMSAEPYILRVHPDDQPLMRERLADALAQGGTYAVEYRVLGADGTERWVASRGRAKLDAHGKPQWLNGVVLDVTERKRAEEALRQGEAKYRALFESIDEGFCLIELLFDAGGTAHDYRFLEANPAFEKQSGLVGAVGRTIRELVPNHDEHWFTTYGTVALTGVSARFENFAAGMRRFFDVYAFRTGEPHERQVAVLFKDITAKKAAEAERQRLLQEVQAERQRLEQVFAQAPVAIVVFRGPEFVIELANPFYQALVPGKELVGRRFAEVVPELGQHVWDAFHRVLDTGEPFVANEWLVPYDRDRDGVPEEHWFNVVYHPLRDSDGPVTGMVAVCSEVTTQVLARQELERVNRGLEEFAHVASHDLQEPLRMVNSYSQLLVRRLGKDVTDEQKAFVGFIQGGVKRMETLIQDLLAYSRTVHTVDEMVTSEASLEEALAQALTVVDTSLTETGAAITHVPLPTVRGDTTQLSHVFQNLLSNALKYRKPDTPLEVHISARRQEGEWVISVRDNGIGFDPGQAERIFGLFKRLHRDDEYPGTGLGLAICRRIIERYGGKMWAESELGKGSTFHFSLPQRQAS